MTFGLSRTCQKCGITQLFVEFYKNKLCAGGYDTTCKSCMKLQARTYYKENKKEVLTRINNGWLDQKARVLKEKYGMTLDDYKFLHDEQEGKCKLCNSYKELLADRTDQLVVDHCHSSGKVRGLLCQHCNMALGLFKDSINTLTNALEYLKNGLDYNRKN